MPTQKKQTVQTFCVEIHFESRMFSIANSFLIQKKMLNQSFQKHIICSLKGEFDAQKMNALLYWGVLRIVRKAVFRTIRLNSIPFVIVFMKNKWTNGIASSWLCNQLWDIFVFNCSNKNRFGRKMSNTLRRDVFVQLFYEIRKVHLRGTYHSNLKPEYGQLPFADRHRKSEC